MEQLEQARLRILSSVAEGSLSPAEAAQRLAALSDGGDNSDGPAEQAQCVIGDIESGHRHVSIRLRVGAVATGRESVNISLPIALAEAALRFVPRHTLEEAGVHVPNLIAALRSGQTGLIFEGHHDHDRQYIRILVE